MEQARTPLEARGLRPAHALAADRPHGERLRYVAGCRCPECRAANTRYERGRALARKAGDWNGIVSADKAREHLRKLQRQGVGRRAIADSTDIARSILHEIKKGRRLRIRARTERKILAVNAQCRADGALVAAARAWRLIGLLLDEGYTRSELARRLGYKHRGLQFGKHRVTTRIDADVDALYRKLTT